MSRTSNAVRAPSRSNACVAWTIKGLMVFVTVIALVFSFMAFGLGLEKKDQLCIRSDSFSYYEKANYFYVTDICLLILLFLADAVKQQRAENEQPLLP